MKPDTEKILSILASHENDPSNLIAILQDVQAEYNYLSEANLTLIADTLGLSVSKVYSVATFYENFSLEAKGKHIVKVCAGTACHVRKSGPIYDAIYEYLGLHGKKKTSDDGLFTLETVACLGACGLINIADQCSKHSCSCRKYQTGNRRGLCNCQHCSESDCRVCFSCHNSPLIVKNLPLFRIIHCYRSDTLF